MKKITNKNKEKEFN